MLQLSRWLFVHCCALLAPLAAYAVQGVDSVGASPASVSFGGTVSFTASMSQPNTQIFGSLVFQVTRPDGSLQFVSQGLNGTCPSSISMTYTPATGGSYAVRGYVDGGYFPQGSQEPVEFELTPTAPSNFTVAAPSPAGLTWSQLTIPNPAATEAVGATTGELSVGALGEANYQVPIWTTPGTSGMEPKIALAYSSNAGNGQMGPGWSLSGLSSITRGPQTIAVDGVNRAVSYTTSDRYYLDGQRLVVISGSYGANGAEYRTELDSFTKVISYGATTTGPGYFKAWTKSGLILEFGNTGDSAQNGPASSVASWRVNRISDTAGNYMTVTYTESTHATYGFEQVVSRVDYTGNTGLTPYASLRFEYETRPDFSFGYAKGLKVGNTKRLKYIRSYLDASVVRTYTLNYQQEHTTSGPSQLRSVVETGRDGVSFKPLAFYYGFSSASVDWTTSSGFTPPTAISKGDDARGTGLIDVNGDGYPDFVQAIGDDQNSYTATTWLNTGTGWSANTGYRLPKPMSYADGKDRGARFADVNGDGLVDFMYGCSDDTGGHTRAYINTGSTWLPNAAWDIGTFVRADAEFEQRYFLDVNGDGRVDFVYNNGNGGGSEVGAYINTGSGFVYNSSWAPKILSDSTNHSVFVDVNGDGLPDQLQNQTSPARIAVAINTGSGFNLLSSGSADYNKYKAPQPMAHEASGIKIYGTEIVDVNGDGLADMLFYDTWSSSSSTAYLNTGDGWVANSAFNSPYVLGHNGSTRGAALLDLNGDGLPDLTRFEGTQVANRQAAYNTGTGWSSTSYFNGVPYHLDATDGNSFSNSGYQLADLDADGFVDQLWYRTNSSGGFVASGASLNGTLPRNLLASVTNGLGVSASIVYAPLTEKSGASYTIYNPGSAPGADQARIIGPMNVVKRITHQDGVGGSYAVEYAYEGLKSHRTRGNLGFHKVKVTDTRTAIRSTTTNSQVWPYIGTPTETRLEFQESASVWRLLSLSTSTLASETRNAGTTTVVYASQSIERAYDPDSASPTSPTLVSQTTTTTSNLDEFGSVKTLVVDTGGHVKTTTSVYADTETTAATTAAKSSWIIGRLKSSQVVATATGVPNQTRKSAFEYYSGTGLLWKEIVEPDKVANPSSDLENVGLTTTYEYDAYGNVKKKTVAGNGLSAARTAETQYDTRGRFAIWSKNALGHQTTLVANPWFGGLDSSTDPNNLTTSWLYDGFGRVTRETRADATTTNVYRKWTSVTAPTDVVYFVETVASGAPPSLQYFDKFGRQRYSFAMNGALDGSQYIVIGNRTDYDDQGRAAYGYLPYIAGHDQVISSVAKWDEFGRPYGVAIRDDQATVGSALSDPKLTQSLKWADTLYTYSVTGTFPSTRSEAITTNPKNQMTVVASNAQGQKIETINNATGSGVNKGRVRYAYDAFGNLLKTSVYKTDTTFFDTVLTFDGRGRKKTMADPDMGSWSYAYNALGELISQIDGKGQTTTMTYDVLGRMTARSDADGATTWLYDSSPWDTRKGFLYAITGPATVRDGFQRRYIKNLEYDTYGRLKKSAQFMNWPDQTQHYVTLQDYDSFGRPSVMTYPDGFKVANVYDAQGFLKKVEAAGGSIAAPGEAPPGYVFWEAKAFDARGNIERYDLGNGLNVRRAFDGVTGRLQSIDSGNSPTATNVMALDYVYDVLGNMTSRSNAYGTYTEFGYDGLNRLTFAGIAGIMGSSYTYDALGNILTKSGVAGTYGYGTKPHAVTSADGFTYAYDANGNALTKKQGAPTVMEMDWTASNKLWRITKRNTGGTVTNKALFWFDESGQRIAQMDSVRGTTHYVGSHFEEVWDGLYNWTGTFGQRIKCYIMTPSGRTAVRVVNFVGQGAGTVQIRYFHQDNLGSVYAVTDPNGAVEQRMTYDPWGKQTVTLDLSGNTRPEGNIDRGYTDHEMLPDYGLIHMNGRVFDPTLARFLSADPFIDDAKDSQSYNRYSYVNNSPLNHSDPSGFFKLKDALKIVAVVVISVVTAGAAMWAAGAMGLTTAGFTSVGAAMGHLMAGTAVMGKIGVAVAAGFGAGFGAGFASTLLNGGSVGDAFKAGVIGGVIGGISAGVAQGIGHGFGGNWEPWQQALAHGASQGAITEAAGGEFRHGFTAAFFTKMAGPSILAAGEDWGVAGRTAAAAMVGGSASALGGGKFANGAVSGAFTHLFNEEQALKTRDKLTNLFGHEKKGIYYTATLNNGHGTRGWLKDSSKLAERMDALLKKHPDASIRYFEVSAHHSITGRLWGVLDDPGLTDSQFVDMIRSLRFSSASVHLKMCNGETFAASVLKVLPMGSSVHYTDGINSNIPGSPFAVPSKLQGSQQMIKND